MRILRRNVLLRVLRLLRSVLLWILRVLRLLRILRILRLLRINRLFFYNTISTVCQRSAQRDICLAAF